MVFAALADLRATPSDDAELVDQVHLQEWLRILGRRDEWAYVQVEDDHYFGWIRSRSVSELPGTPHGRVVASLLAPIYDAADKSSKIVGALPAGTVLPTSQAPCVEGPWIGIHGWVSAEQDRNVRGPRVYSGYLSLEDAIDPAEFPDRPPTPDDLLATAEAFLGAPYLWGGTTALGMDCSGFVQQVYRLNGIRLDRDADQQATEGRQVESPRAGDLIFFGEPRITHVALATGERSFLHAPQSGGAVERSELSPQRVPKTIRRYLAEPA
jgi:cell wall-associated NlpC family hydrolase